MFRKPIGDYSVGLKKYDTLEIGDEFHRRRVPMTFFYPSEAWGRAAGHGKAGNFPVILYNHGLCGFEMESTVLCADLASHGYVVVSVGHPYGAAIVTYTDGKRFEYTEPFERMRHRLDEIEPLWYEDILAAIDFLKEMNQTDSVWKGKLAFERLGAIGVSFGGCCSIAAALKHEELCYAVNLDGSLFVKPKYLYPETPVFVMCSPFNIKAYAGLEEHGCTHVEVEKIKKVSHFEFSDGVYLSEKGKQNREWADRISRHRAERILEFIKRQTVS